MISHVLIADDKTGNKSTLHNCVTDSSHLKIFSVTDKDKPQSMEKNQLNVTHLFCGPPQLPLLTLGISNLQNQIVSLPFSKSLWLWCPLSGLTPGANMPRSGGGAGRSHLTLRAQVDTGWWCLQSCTGWRRRLLTPRSGAILPLSWNRTYMWRISSLKI